MTEPLPSRRRRAVEAACVLAAMGLATIVIAGFFGDRARPLDSIGHFRAHASALLLLVGVGLLALRLYAAGLSSMGAAGLGLFTVIPFLLPASQAGSAAPGAPRYSLLQMNLRFDAPDKSAALGLIGRVSPDVVTLQEMTRDWRSALETLSARYPYQFYCAPVGGAGDVAILSRRPFAEGDAGVCDLEGGFAAKRIDFNGLQLVVGAQHLGWPWPSLQWRQIARLAPKLALLGDPLIIAGDFNAAPWSAALRALALASDTRIVAGVGPTWMSRPLPSFLACTIGLPIDNVLASPGVDILAVERQAATTSDHLPVLVTFTLRFARPEEPAVQTVETAIRRSPFRQDALPKEGGATPVKTRGRGHGRLRTI